jgi:hypothetical protein
MCHFECVVLNACCTENIGNVSFRHRECVISSVWCSTPAALRIWVGGCSHRPIFTVQLALSTTHSSGPCCPATAPMASDMASTSNVLLAAASSLAFQMKPHSFLACPAKCSTHTLRCLTNAMLLFSAESPSGSPLSLLHSDSFSSNDPHNRTQLQVRSQVWVKGIFGLFKFHCLHQSSRDLREGQMCQQAPREQLHKPLSWPA